MHDTGVLNVGALLQNQPAKITAQAGRWPHITVRADEHIANQDGRGVHVGRRIHDRREAINFIDAGLGHGRPPFVTKNSLKTHSLYQIFGRWQRP